MSEGMAKKRPFKHTRHKKSVPTESLAYMSVGEKRQLFHLDSDCFSNIADRLGLADIVRLLQVGCLHLRRRMTCVGGCVRRINVTNDDDDLALGKHLPSCVRDLFPNIAEIRVIPDAYNKYTYVGKQHMKVPTSSSLCVLDAPSHWIAVDKKTVFPNLHTIAISHVQSADALEIALPSLTSLEWCLPYSTRLPELGASLALQMQSLVMRPSTLNPTWLQQYRYWPQLHTLRISLGDPASQHANAHIVTDKACPSLTSLSLADIDQASCFMEVGAIKSLKILKVHFVHLSLTKILRQADTSGLLFPSSVTHLEIQSQLGRYSTAESIAFNELIHILPSHLEYLVLDQIELDTHWKLLSGLSCLKRLVAERDEYVRNSCSNQSPWYTLTASLEKFIFPPSHFQSFEMVVSPKKFRGNIAEIALLNHPTIGYQMVRNVMPGQYMMLSFEARCAWLGAFTSSEYDIQVISKWALLLHVITHAANSHAVLDSIGETYDKMLRQHMDRSHPTMFRHLLHLVFLSSSAIYGGYALLRSAHSSQVIDLLASSPYHYTCPVNDTFSEITLWALEFYANREGSDPHSSIENKKLLLQAMDNPQEADLACRGEVNACKWLDKFPIWRALRLARDMMHERFRRLGGISLFARWDCCRLQRVVEVFPSACLIVNVDNNDKSSEPIRFRVTVKTCETSLENVVREWQCSVTDYKSAVSDAVACFVEQSLSCK